MYKKGNISISFYMMRNNTGDNYATTKKRMVDTIRLL
ncbi:hypothetical protein FHW36_107273 [Chitinophaga polysaccharea]|uniref:Uncharacterized protein n=1 Tax=Chitinophaga polysaccharea TaxID=1293035 RepID=A0A561PGU9_9BACT|nr:hypothetical protein FHW36_107273 [Chitinophaga polysaccharea]